MRLTVITGVRSRAAIVGDGYRAQYNRAAVGGYNQIIGLTYRKIIIRLVNTPTVLTCYLSNMFGGRACRSYMGMRIKVVMTRISVDAC